MILEKNPTQTDVEDVSEGSKEIYSNQSANLDDSMKIYLKEKKHMNGNHMRPQKGNSGKDIQRNFDRQQRIDVLKGFYNKYPLKYWDPKLDFYRNNKMMKQWRPW